MSPRTRAVIFALITAAWLTLAVFSAIHGQWIVAVIDFVAAVACAAFAYRTLRPRRPSSGGGRTKEIKPLRAPRPPR